MANLYTQGGYPFGEVASALQKTIRRGDEEAALYWALEFIPKFEGYLWRRLMVIANEDIGIASPDVLVLIPALRETYMVQRQYGKGDECRLVLANAILLMCRSPKTRIADHFQTVVDAERKLALARGEGREIPDYAVDKHTRAGRHMGRGFGHWLSEGCRLAFEGDVDDPYAEKARQLWLGDLKGVPKTKWPKFSKRQWAAQASLFEASLEGGDASPREQSGLEMVTRSGP